jgi:hypothetical protein
MCYWFGTLKKRGAVDTALPRDADLIGTSLQRFTRYPKEKIILMGFRL